MSGTLRFPFLLLILLVIAVIGATQKQKINYNVKVKTGDRTYAATDANVYLKIYGSNRITREIALEKSENNKDLFEKGQTDNFKVEARDVGKIRKIKIRHDNKNTSPGWFLEDVRIDILSKCEHLMFDFHRWLDKDSQLEDEKTPSQNKANKVTYNVLTRTGDNSDAGTGANVYLQIFGAKGNTKEMHLKQSVNTSEMFNRGQTDYFKLEARDVGKLTKIKIRHDDTGRYPAWYLDEAQISSPKCEEPFLFDFHRWLSSSDGDKLIELEKEPVKKEITYIALTKTGDRSGAGTRANVYLQIFGLKGNTREMHLKQSVNTSEMFNRGQTDYFKLETRDVGKLTKIKIRHDNSGQYPGWYLDEVQIKSPDFKKPFVFDFQRWLSTSDNDKKLEVEKEPSLREITYIALTKTGDRTDAETGANVYLQIFGLKGNTREMHLKKSVNTSGIFSRGQTDYFKLETKDVGKLTKIKIRHDNSGQYAGWYLDQVQIKSPNFKKPFVFDFQRWLSTSDNDKKLEVEKEPSFREITYIALTKTGDRTDAETGANVYLQIFGLKGNTREMHLKKSVNTSGIFSRGQTDYFKLETKDVGKLTKIKIRHDNSGQYAGWYLDQVQIKSPNFKKPFVFDFQRWLSTSDNDKKLEVEKEPSLREITYIALTKTGDLSGAGTGANVYLQIFGLKGNTREMHLKKSVNTSEIFSRGQTDYFKLETKNVGKLTKIKIRHDNSGKYAGWYLDEVQIKSPNFKKPFVFDFQRWLSTSENDKKIEVEKEPSLREITYIALTKTGDRTDAETGANVYLQIFGLKGNTREMHLKKSVNTTGIFSRGQTDYFKLESKDVGKLTKIKIRHDNSGQYAGWYLEDVQIISPKFRKPFVFDFHRWLSASDGDKKIELEKKPSLKKG